MSSSAFITLSCDRCRAGETFADRASPDGWGQISAAQIGARARIGAGPAGFDDLCPACVEALMLWFQAATEPLEQPVPAPSPPPALFTLEDRRRAIELAINVLADQVEAAITILRETPTSILSGEPIDGALAGARDRAEALVDDILERARLRAVRRKLAPAP